MIVAGNISTPLAGGQKIKHIGDFCNTSNLPSIEMLTLVASSLNNHIAALLAIVSCRFVFCLSMVSVKYKKVTNCEAATMRHV